MKHFVQIFIARLDEERLVKMRFEGNRPGNGLIKRFLKLHSEIRMNRGAELELFFT